MQKSNPEIGRPSYGSQEVVMRFVVCVEVGELGDFPGDDLTIGRVYEVLEESEGLAGGRGVH